MDTKQVIMVRKDLKMPKGKLAAQVAHASLSVILNYSKRLNDIPEPMQHWLDNSFTKVVVGVADLDELWEIYMEVMIANIPCSIIRDEGRTVFKESTFTCVGVGPDEVEKIDKFVGHLKLY
jgi:PTH2 family peptidyl-tRNA hydrolase